MRLIILAVVLGTASIGLAQGAGAGEGEGGGAAADTTQSTAHSGEAAPHPTIAHSAEWAENVVAVILGLFALALLIGPVIRASMPQEIPPAHSHDEPPGTSGHHGVSGTLDEHPPEHANGQH